tara:strand:- start:284 stop:1024 length:741 start_codon:yes stop_codon:yes gene_type:complete
MNNRLQLGVNVDHVATVREARGTTYPDPLEAAQLCREAGADGITVHLREDRRHIQERDVRAIHRAVALPLNLEMANNTDVVAIALDVGPAEVCVVPERREELTTEGGLDAAGTRDALVPVVAAMAGAGIEVSLFIDPDPAQIAAASDLGVPTIELHTGRYCDTTGAEQDSECARLIAGAGQARDAGLRVNAGHGINLDNIGGILRIPHLGTLNIGHSMVARAVIVGMLAAVREMRCAMDAYDGGQA